MKIAVAGWKIPAYGAWGAGAVLAFIGSFLPWVKIHLAFNGYVISGTTAVAETTTLMLAVVAFGAMLAPHDRIPSLALRVVQTVPSPGGS